MSTRLEQRPRIIPKALTPGRMASRLNLPLHRVNYILRTRNISPRAYAGTLRIYSESDFDRVSQELQQIAGANRHGC